MNSRDLLARLLANENLNIVRAPVSTASMDIRSRTLTLPQWKEMSDDVEEMLIGHEVGHALFTTDDYIKEDGTRALHGYMNVIEDVRIEKKIKNKYPGLRASFLRAYRELNERDFFEIKGKDMSKLLLIDRINLYYKCGFNCGVKFTTEEMEFVRAADRCDSIEDVYLLAKELLAFTMEERKKFKQSLAEQQLDIKMSKEDMDDLEEVEYESDSDMFDDIEEDEEDTDTKELEEDEDGKQHSTGSDPNAKINEEVAEEEVESTTEKALRQRLSNLADVTTQVEIYEPVLKTRSEPIIGYKRILTELPIELEQYRTKLVNRMGDAKAADTYIACQTKSLEKFKTDSSRVVNYLVKEFEMKKSATAYKRSTVAKTGELNVRKLHAYKLTDDMFKRITVVPDAKNHGMVFLLDWSGSMNEVMEDTVKQVINLAMFCQRAQIAYQVFAFTNGYQEEGYNPYATQPVDPNFKGFVCGNFNLFEFFSNKMSNTEFNRMVELLIRKPWAWSPQYSLNSTPLNEGLLFMVDYLGKFIKNNNVEKTSFITLTDGEGHGIQGMTNINHQRYNSAGVRCKQVNYLRDPITRREYSISGDGTEQTKVFLRIIKDRYNASTIGFHVIRNSQRDMASFIRYNVPECANGAHEYAIIQQIKKDFRTQDFSMLSNAGRDELYLLPASKMETDEGKLTVSTDMNSKQIAKQFTKFLDVKKTSRLLLNRFVSLVA